MSEDNWNNWNNEENSFSGSLDPTSVNAQQDTYTGAEAQTEQSNEAGPQPMPSDDNMYRFQNVNAGQKEPDEGRSEKKGKHSGGVVKILVSAVVFGVVAAACFFVVLKISGFRFSGENEGGGMIGTVDTTAGNEVMAVSGSAAGFSDVSGIVDRAMPSIVAITETSTVSSYFGQSYSTEGAGSGFIVMEDK